MAKIQLELEIQFWDNLTPHSNDNSSKNRSKNTDYPFAGLVIYLDEPYIIDNLSIRVINILHQIEKPLIIPEQMIPFLISSVN